MPERRQHPRSSKRVRVNFWRRQAPERIIHGYTSDLSTSGAFITTEQPVGRNGRIQVQFQVPAEKGAENTLLEAIVARSAQVPRDLQRVKPGGMGIRFLRVEQLVSELLKAAAHNLPGDAASSPTAATEVSAQVAPAVASFAVDLSDRERFLRLWQQDIRLGGMFVETPSPAAQASIIELVIEAPGAEPFTSRATVTQVFEPSQGSASLLCGMGVTLVDADQLLGHLGQLAERLRSGD